MPRVIGIDPGTVTVDLCGLDDGRVFLDLSIPTADALASPSRIPDLLDQHAPLDLVVGPSGYGLPLTAARDLTDADLRLAFLAAEGESGGIGGLRSLVRALGHASIAGPLDARRHPSRDGSRASQGQSRGHGHRRQGVRGGAGNSRACRAPALRAYRTCRSSCSSSVARSARPLPLTAGRIVDGVGGSSGPLGMRAAGALDGEVAFLAGSVSKESGVLGRSSRRGRSACRVCRGSRLVTSPRRSRGVGGVYGERRKGRMPHWPSPCRRRTTSCSRDEARAARACVMSSRTGCAASWTAFRFTRFKDSLPRPARLRKGRHSSPTV